jgi:hypothetical protein
MAENQNPYPPGGEPGETERVCRPSWFVALFLLFAPEAAHLPDPIGVCKTAQENETALGKQTSVQHWFL